MFFETIGPIEPPIWAKMCPENQFYGFHSAGMEFFMEKFYEQYLVPHSPQKRGSTHFCRPTPALPQKWSYPPKIIFCGYF